MASTVVREQGEGNATWMLGGRYEVKVAGDDTDGAVTVGMSLKLGLRSCSS